MRKINLEASKKWEKISEYNRNKLICNVFCINCGVCTIAPDFNIENLPDGDLIINGKCSSCGDSVARVIEKDWWE